MNLLVKKKIGWIIAVSVFFIGCEDDLGLELPPDDRQAEIKFKEFSLSATNLYFDSLRTDGGTSLLVGEYSDPIFGSVKATGYSEYFYRNGPLPSYVILKDQNGIDSLVKNSQNIAFDTLSFDSISVTLRIAEILTSNSILTQNLDFFKLQDSIFSNVIYLADREIQLGESVGSDISSFDTPDVSTFDFTTDTLLMDFRLDDSYGQEFFDFIADLEPSETDTLTRRKIRFPGIGFVSNGSNGLIRFELADPFTNIEIHLSSPDSTYVIQFQLEGSNKFTRLERDRQGTDFAELNDKRALDVSTDFVYFNPIAGIMPRIDLSPFLDFVKEEEESDIVIQRAQLSIGAIKNETTVPDADSSRLYFSNADSSNMLDISFNINWSGAFTNPFSTLTQTNNAYLIGRGANLIMPLDSLEDYNQYNAFPTGFFQNLLDQTQDGVDNYSDNIVMVTPQDYPLGQSTIHKDSIKLQILYIKLKK